MLPVVATEFGKSLVIHIRNTYLGPEIALMLNTRYFAPRVAALRWRISDWQYAVSGRRDLRLDLLRGFAVFAMIVDHLGDSSWFHAITGGNRFLVSAAEAFVFISGLLVGIIYGDIMRQSGWWQATKKAVARAWKLYLLTVPLTLLFITLVFQLRLPFAEWYEIGDPWQLVVDVATLRRTFAFADIPLLYTQLLLAAPIGLWLLHRARTGLLMALSVGLWGAFQIAPNALWDFPWKIEGNWTFPVAAWQVLFFVAMAIGYHRQVLARRLRSFARFRYLFALSVAVAGLIVFYQSADWNLPELTALFAKQSLGAGRLVASAIVFAAFYLTSTLFWRPLQTFAGWLMNPLGENSLYGYTMHVFMLVGYYTLWQFVGHGAPDSTVNTVLQAAAVLLVWQMIRHRVLFRVIPR